MGRCKWGIFDICHNEAHTNNQHQNTFAKQTPLILSTRPFYCALGYLFKKLPRNSSTIYTSTVAFCQTIQMGHLRHLLQPKCTKAVSTPIFLPNKHHFDSLDFPSTVHSSACRHLLQPKHTQAKDSGVDAERVRPQHRDGSGPPTWGWDFLVGT